MNKRTIFLALLILGTAFWGISFPVTKMAVTGVAQSIFLFYRFAFATLVLSVVFFPRLRRMKRKDLIGGASLAIPLTFSIFFQTLALKHTTASQCAFIAGTTVIVVPILKFVIYKASIDLKSWCAALIALLGLFVISIKDGLSIGAGDIYTIVGAIGFAFYLIRVERYSISGDIVPTIVPMFGTATAIMFIVALTDPAVVWMPRSPQFWQGICYCALLSTAFMYTVSNIAQRYIAAEKVAIIYLFEPVFAAVAAFALLGEQLTLRLLLGGFFIFAGTIISEMNLKKIRLA